MKHAIESMARSLGGEADFAIVHVWVHLPTPSARDAFLAWNKAGFRRPVLSVEPNGQRYDVKLG